MRMFRICFFLVCAFLTNTLSAAERLCVSVKPGDNLEKIVTEDFHLDRSTVDAIAAANGVANKNLIHPGDKVCDTISVSHGGDGHSEEPGEKSRVSTNWKSMSTPKKVTKRYAHVIHLLGRAPFAIEKKPATARQNLAALRVLGYSRKDAREIMRNKASGKSEVVEVPCGSIIPEMIFRGGKKLSGGILMDFCHGKVPVESEFAIKICASSGRCVYQFSTCRNYFPSFESPLKKEEAHSEEVKAVSPTVAPPRIRAQGESPSALVEYELNAGVFAWRNGLAKGRTQWGEALLWTPDAGTGISYGAGGYISDGGGDSKTASYSWHERAYGAQVGVKGNSLGAPDDEGRRFPRNWQVKVRILRDQVKGSNSESGYAMKQSGPKECLYGEYIAQKDALWTYGITGEGCIANHQSITSTWSGDTPKDRGSVQMNVFAERKLGRRTAVRGIVGVAHQNWDGLNLARGTLEFRYHNKENGLVVAAGPSVAIPIGKLPKEYAGVSRSKLITPAGLVRVELGGVIRNQDAKARAKSVHLAGDVSVSADSKDEKAIRLTSKSQQNSWNSFGFNNK